MNLYLKLHGRCEEHGSYIHSSKRRSSLEMLMCKFVNRRKKLLILDIVDISPLLVINSHYPCWSCWSSWSVPLPCHGMIGLWSTGTNPLQYQSVVCSIDGYYIDLHSIMVTIFHHHHSLSIVILVIFRVFNRLCHNYLCHHHSWPRKTLDFPGFEAWTAMKTRDFAGFSWCFTGFFHERNTCALAAQDIYAMLDLEMPLPEAALRCAVTGGQQEVVGFQGLITNNNKDS